MLSELSSPCASVWLNTRHFVSSHIWIWNIWITFRTNGIGVNRSTVHSHPLIMGYLFYACQCLCLLLTALKRDNGMQTPDWFLWKNVGSPWCYSVELNTQSKKQKYRNIWGYRCAMLPVSWTITPSSACSVSWWMGMLRLHATAEQAAQCLAVLWMLNCFIQVNSPLWLPTRPLS